MNNSSIFSQRGQWIRAVGRMKIGSIFSHRVKAYKYNAEKGLLHFDFRSGTNQDYCSVSDNVYQQLENAQDKNEYYSRHIFGKYQIM